MKIYSREIDKNNCGERVGDVRNAIIFQRVNERGERFLKLRSGGKNVGRAMTDAVFLWDASLAYGAVISVVDDDVRSA